MKVDAYFASGLTALTASLVAFYASAASFDLGVVNGIEAFTGSARAKELLGINGFVVSDPPFKQIFEPYIHSPNISKSEGEHTPLPVFITTDSAWHTYHVLLEEGVKQMEEMQSQRLLSFSRRLLAVLRSQNLRAEGRDLWLYASVGLALQDENHRQTLAGGDKRIVEGLLSSSADLQVPIGFTLSPTRFRAASFYEQSPRLRGYFAARQWYGSVVFRLLDARETRLAIALACLVNGDEELLGLWKRLSDPFDAFLAPPEDGSVRIYAAASKAIVGKDVPIESLSDQHVIDLQKMLNAQLPSPRINDQLLSPAEYAQFPKLTRGFRLLPPRRLPCAICFQNTVDPVVPNRTHPSGLDFFAASPVLRSPAAIQALQGAFGKGVSDRILKTDCGPMPDTLHGEAMQLLATLQKPMAAQAPAALRTHAWADLQLWTQLGAWAEQRHTWALHTKLTVEYAGGTMPPKGIVAPYPEFFSGLAALVRHTSKEFEKSGLDQPFDPKRAARELLHTLNVASGKHDPADQQLFAAISASMQAEDPVKAIGNLPAEYAQRLDKLSATMEQASRFERLYFESHGAVPGGDQSDQLQTSLRKDLYLWVETCAATGVADPEQTATLRLFHDCRQTPLRLLTEFAPVCDRLAVLAAKSLNRQALTKEDAAWTDGYGQTLARFHFYYGNSYLEPKDDFPIVTPVFSSPITGSMLYAGLARPQALYVIVPDGQAQQLYRGAVMTYREFVCSNESPLADESWRALIAEGRTPHPPEFTRSFYAEASPGELLTTLRAIMQGNDFHADLRELFWQLGSRTTEKDLTGLIQLLRDAKGGQRAEILDLTGEIICRMPWEPHHKELVKLLGMPVNDVADTAAWILANRPASIDSNLLISKFARQPTRTRRLYCALLSRLPRQTEASRKLLLGALRDPADGVRWQAALAIGATGWKDAQSTSALLAALSDTNEFVGAVAAHSLARLRATNSAPLLLVQLRIQLQRSNRPVQEKHVDAIKQDLNSTDLSSHVRDLLDPPGFSLLIRKPRPDGVTRPIRLMPPREILNLREERLETAVIEALGDLGHTPAVDVLFKYRGTEYEPAAIRALNKLAPERLVQDLLTTASNRQIDTYARERALVLLCELGATNQVKQIAALLDDLTPISYSPPLPGPEWRMCDRAAVSIALLLGWEKKPIYAPLVRPEKRTELLTRAREWAKTALQPGEASR